LFKRLPRSDNLKDMQTSSFLDVRPEIAAALHADRPIVALESTLIAHGLPWPLNLETARLAEAAVRDEGAVPATIAVWRGRPTIGLSGAELEELARAKDVLKASRRDLGAAVAQQRTAATTVAATMFLAHKAGIRLFATGGIGGVHRDSVQSGDVSADLIELARTPVAVVCAGVKCILDVPRTLEVLEMLGVPVVGYRTDDFPGFFMRTCGGRVSCRVEAAEDAARVLAEHWRLDGAGILVAQAIDADKALPENELNAALAEAEREAAAAGIRGSDVTPFLLARLAERTGRKTVLVNRDLVIANARLAARVARAFMELPHPAER
jgi:pseudouridine-5'-phosphate glycosidase